MCRAVILKSLTLTVIVVTVHCNSLSRAASAFQMAERKVFEKGQALTAASHSTYSFPSHVFNCIFFTLFHIFYFIIYIIYSILFYFIYLKFKVVNCFIAVYKYPYRLMLLLSVENFQTDLTVLTE